MQVSLGDPYGPPLLLNHCRRKAKTVFPIAPGSWRTDRRMAAKLRRSRQPTVYQPGILFAQKILEINQGVIAARELDLPMAGYGIGHGRI